MARTIVLPCALGDITIGWEPENDAEMLPILQAMLDAKTRFHIIRKRKITPVTKITQAADTRKIVIPNAILQKLWREGIIGVGVSHVAESIGKIAKTPQEVIEQDTLATSPMAGG